MSKSTRIGPRMSEVALVDYRTGETIREATAEELRASVEAAERDGGAGVIMVDGRRCYVEGEEVAS